MLATDAVTAASNSTVANISSPSNHTSGDKSATQSDNQHIPHGNPTLALIDNITTSEVYAARQTYLPSDQQNTRRLISRKVSIATRAALTAEIKADIRVKFKLSEVTFEQLPLVKTLAAVQILTKLANRTVKFAKQDFVFNELTGVTGKLIFSPFVARANAPQKTQISPQLAYAQAYEAVPELVHLSCVKQGGNVLLAICHFYNAAVTRTVLK